ncbi:MAG: hypothetical protein OEM83_02495 [Gammaproteobacteria bacterium]|nr:hypothetical protein [Gammaproteobacteria bacterium]MDH5512642.1 hypothetical protein [Gammaproteobacteria bacterium]
MNYPLITAGCCVALAAAFSPAAESQTPSTPGPTRCADPAADNEVVLVSKFGPASGRVRITGIVTNRGTTAWKPTTSTHRLRMVLASKNSAADPETQLAPPVDIFQLEPGQQYRIDHQVNWDANLNAAFPKYIVRFSDAGQVGAKAGQYNPNCRTDNDRREIAPSDINRLFVARPPDPPLRIQDYRLLGGVGINTVETTLSYSKNSANAGKITASVADPDSGTANAIPVSGSTGNTKLRVHVPCDRKNIPNFVQPDVSITYRLWGSLILHGGSGWVPGYSVEQTIPYRELCPIQPPGKPGQ